MTNNQLAENSVIQLLNSVKLARDNAELADNRVDHSFYYALTIALEELQERRKADSEPVIVVGDDGGDALSYRRLIQSFEPGTKLYRHAQPAQVVPEEMTPEMMRAVQLNSELGAYAASNLSGAYDLFAEFWKVACRAAMLASAPQSPGIEPATVPGKWIPVSERMPDVGVKVLCFPVKDEPIHATFNGQLWLQDVSWSGSEEPIDNVIPVTVTHWMPLPAGPQEVKGE